MEEAILGVLLFQMFDRLRLTVLSDADHVMPPKDLVEDDAVKKAAEAQAQNNSRARQRCHTTSIAHDEAQVRKPAP